MDRGARRHRRARWQGTRLLRAAQGIEARAPARSGARVSGQHALHQHHFARAGAAVPGRRVDGAPGAQDHPLERGGDGVARQSARSRNRRPSLDIRLDREPLRGRLQSLLPRQGRGPGRPGVLPGTRRAGHLLARLSRGPAHREPARSLPPRDRARARALVLPAPATDAGPLGIPDGLDGARPPQRDLSGALQPLSPPARDRGHVEEPRLGVHRRRGDGRARGGRSARAGRSRQARQPDVRGQLQPAAARWPGARQRQDHPGAGGALPRRRMERDQGHLVARLGLPARPGLRRDPGRDDERDRRWRVAALHHRVGRIHPAALLRQGSAAPQDGRERERR